MDWCMSVWHNTALTPSSSLASVFCMSLIPSYKNTGYKSRSWFSYTLTCNFCCHSQVIQLVKEREREKTCTCFSSDASLSKFILHIRFVVGCGSMCTMIKTDWEGKGVIVCASKVSIDSCDHLYFPSSYCLPPFHCSTWTKQEQTIAATKPSLPLFSLALHLAILIKLFPYEMVPKFPCWKDWIHFLVETLYESHVLIPRQQEILIQVDFEGSSHPISSRHCSS